MALLPTSVSAGPAAGQDLLRHAVRRLDTYLRQRHALARLSHPSHTPS